jgi:predicted neuraminidase
VTWTEDQPFFHNTLGWLPRNLTITLADGTLILPLSDERNGHGVDLSFFLATKDNGATWTQSDIMSGGVQPTIIQRTDGSLLAYLRVRPNILASESRDEGKTWTAPTPTQWKNPDAGISMTRLNNGHLLLVFNNQDNSRSPLHIARSVDEGRTWSKPLMLESNPGEYSYPSIFQAPDGKIHIIYTFRRYSIKHIEMNEDWLTHLERPD